MKGDGRMTLNDFIFVASFDDLCVGVYKSGYYNPDEEFDIKQNDFRPNHEKIKQYGDYIVTGVWILNLETIAVSIMKKED